MTLRDPRDNTDRGSVTIRLRVVPALDLTWEAGISSMPQILKELKKTGIIQNLQLEVNRIHPAWGNLIMSLVHLARLAGKISAVSRTMTLYITTELTPPTFSCIQWHTRLWEQ
jgi:hypothetical protein